MYLLCIAPAIQRSKENLLRRCAPFCLGIVISPLTFSIQRLRYPNPDLPPLENIWAELGNAWLYGKTILDDSFGGPQGSILFRFPGIGLGIAWLLSWGFVRLSCWVWRTGAGRTVPAQIVLYLLPLSYLAVLLGVYRLSGVEAPEEKPPSLSERLNYARALHETLPPNTRLFVSWDLYDPCVYLRASEGVRNPVDLEPGGEPFWSHGAFQTDSLGTPYSRTPVAFSEGKNWVGVAGEPLEFAPQHLLGATEVYMATPTYFIGADPTPELFFGGKPFEPKVHPAPDLTAWGFDGGHFYLYREHRDPVWRPLEDAWQANYFGFLLADRLKTWTQPLPRPKATGMEDFYR